MAISPGEVGKWNAYQDFSIEYFVAPTIGKVPKTCAGLFKIHDTLAFQVGFRYNQFFYSGSTLKEKLLLKALDIRQFKDIPRLSLKFWYTATLFLYIALFLMLFLSMEHSLYQDSHFKNPMRHLCYRKSVLLSCDCNRFHGISTWTGVIGNQAKNQRAKRSCLDNRASDTFKVGKDCDELPGERNKPRSMGILTKHGSSIYFPLSVHSPHDCSFSSHVLAEYQELQD